MDNSWKVYVLDNGLFSLENTEMEERGFYRLKVFLKNLYKNRLTEHETTTKSLLFRLAKGLSPKYDEKDIVRNAQMLETVYVDDHKLLLSWSKPQGIALISDSPAGNYIIEEVSDRLKNSTVAI